MCTLKKLILDDQWPIIIIICIIIVIIISHRHRCAHHDHPHHHHNHPHDHDHVAFNSNTMIITTITTLFTAAAASPSSTCSSSSRPSLPRHHQSRCSSLLCLLRPTTIQIQTAPPKRKARSGNGAASALGFGEGGERLEASKGSCLHLSHSSSSWSFQSQGCNGVTIRMTTNSKHSRIKYTTCMLHGKKKRTQSRQSAGLRARNQSHRLGR